MNKKTQVAIVGHGYVGKAMDEFFSNHYEVRVFDVKYINNGTNIPANSLNPKTFVSWTKDDINECDIGIVCLPTQSTEDGSCDVSLVEEAIDWLKTPLVLIKSTISPGTTERLKTKTGKRIVFSPEYCGESRYWTEYKFHTDVKETPWFTFGGDPKDTEEMVNLFIRVVGPTKVYHQTDATTAELAKYVENTFYALKITFCYEIANICEKLGVDYYKLREAWLLDPRINKMHTAVFQESENCFAGKCLPKDVSALIRASLDVDYEPRLIQEIMASNDRIGRYRRHKKQQR